MWFVFYKKSAGRARISYDDAVEEALCFGWIDSLPRKLDAERSMLLFTPRKAGSGWSKPNKERIERLIAEGLMSEAGQEKIAAAKRDGSWSKLDAAEALEIPPDLAEAFRADETAKDNFARFSPSVRKGILSWIASAKRFETRAARVAKTVALAAQNKRANYDPE